MSTSEPAFRLAAGTESTAIEFGTVGGSGGVPV